MIIAAASVKAKGQNAAWSFVISCRAMCQDTRAKSLLCEQDASSRLQGALPLDTRMPNQWLYSSLSTSQCRWRALRRQHAASILILVATQPPVNFFPSMIESLNCTKFCSLQSKARSPGDSRRSILRFSELGQDYMGM